MRARILVAACLTLAACSETFAPAASSPPDAATSDVDTADVYIVVFANRQTPTAVSAASAVARYGVKPRLIFRRVLNGMSVKSTPEAIAALAKSPDVAYVEKVVLGGVADVANSWGLDEIDQKGGTRDGQFNPVNRGEGVTAYIIDTGINPELDEYGGRAAIAFDVFGQNGRDCVGHGSHVSGIVGSRSYGVANQVQLRGVRAIDCNKQWSTENALNAMDWVAAHAVHPAVVNMSVTFHDYRQSVNDAATALVNSGVFVAAAAANDQVDACTRSPASTPSVFTVSAFDENHVRPAWADWGNCVDLYAPGVNIISLLPYGGSTPLSGTSMASPHVAGVAANYLAEDPTLSPAAITERLKSNATKFIAQTGKPGTTDGLYSYIYEVVVLGDTLPYEGTSVTYTANPYLMRPPYTITWKNHLNRSETYCTGPSCTMYFAASYNDFLIDVDVIDALGRTARRVMWVDVQGGFTCAPGQRAGAMCAPPIAKR